MEARVKYVLLLLLFYRTLDICVSDLFMGNNSVSRGQAVSACNNLSSSQLVDGDILSDDDITNIANKLSEGDSAWVGNIAAFSEFVFYFGCFPDILLGNQNHVFARNNIYHCSQACKDTTARYIGLQNDNCFCFDTLPEYKPSQGQSAPTCDTLCNSYFNESCGDNGAAAIYGMVKKEDIGLNPAVPSFHQCVMLSKTNQILVHTESCVSQFSNCAYICRVPTETRCQLNDVCIYFGSRTYSWHNAKLECEHVDSGFLFNASLSSHAQLNRNLIDTFRYWTGFFRTFEMGSRKNDPDAMDACVAIRKTVSSVQFEATDCKQNKSYICDTPSTSFVPVTTITTTSRSKTEALTTDDDFPSWAIIVIVCSLVVMLLVVIIILVIVRKKRKGRSSEKIARAGIPNDATFFRTGEPDDMESSPSGVTTLRGDANELDLYNSLTYDHQKQKPVATLDFGHEYDAGWKSGPDANSSGGNRKGSLDTEKDMKSSQQTRSFKPTVNATHPEPLYSVISRENKNKKPNDQKDKHVYDHTKPLSNEHDEDWYDHTGNEHKKPKEATADYNSLSDVNVGSASEGAYDHANNSNIERPVKTYFDYMYNNLKRNTNNFTK